MQSYPISFLLLFFSGIIGFHYNLGVAESPSTRDSNPGGMPSQRRLAFSGSLQPIAARPWATLLHSRGQNVTQNDLKNARIVFFISSPGLALLLDFFFFFDIWSYPISLCEGKLSSFVDGHSRWAMLWYLGLHWTTRPSPSLLYSPINAARSLLAPPPPPPPLPPPLRSSRVGFPPPRRRAVPRRSPSVAPPASSMPRCSH